VFDYKKRSYGEMYGKIRVKNNYNIIDVDIKVENYVKGEVNMIKRG
jgi:hypothetical protein